MTPLDALVLVLAGTGAGTINAIVGSGSLVTFPTLLALGYPPLLANVTNNIGVLPGSVSGVVGYRHELRGQRARVMRLGPASLVGGTAGALLLLVLPASAFRAIVPVLILGACVLVVIGPRLSRWLARRGHRGGGTDVGGRGLFLTALLTGVYGGYFGAAQGVILLALLGIFLDDDLQRINACKNVLAALTNGAAAIIFALATDVAWGAAALLALGSVVGGQIGAATGRRIPPTIYRVVILVVGLVAFGRLVFG